tara:strand:- start:1622 stop:4021 length:2400 start_codon:yes stop_codon:yes gene_type:complete
MIISLKWLKELINTNLDTDVLVSKLTDLGLECSFSDIGVSFGGVIIGKVNSIKKHSNSDHLSLCQVDIGSDSDLQIICGAPNVKNNIYVPVAVVGSTLDNGKFKIKKTKIRGEVSNGMICSEKELGLSENHKGIMVLDGDLNPGDSFEDFVSLEKDTIIDFDLTPNRGDCLSYLGISRELGIIESVSQSEIMENIFKKNPFKIVESGADINSQISVEIEDNVACPLYVGRIVTNVDVKESPSWLKNKLNNLGMKPINIIVDLANYVMLTIGQPMHTFDYDKLPNKKIKVGYSSSDVKFKTLDSIDRSLSSKNLLIKDKNKAIAIAGVIGGKNTEVDSNTKNIFIESALFDSVTIRKSAKALDLSTDASRRYERSVDPDMVKIAIDFLSGMILDYSGGSISKGLIQVGQKPENKDGILFNIDDCNKFLGTCLNNEDIKNIFDRLNISYKKNKNSYICVPPSYRMHDVNRDVDLYEEVARVFGFNNIENSKSLSIGYDVVSSKNNDIVDRIKVNLSNKGFFEHYSNSLLSNKEHEAFAESEGVLISNPLNENMKFIRNSIAPGLLRAVAFNQNRKNENYKLFEIGATYKSADKTPSDEDMCLGIVWPKKQFNHWKDNMKYDFFNSKGDIDSFLDNFNLSEHDYVENKKKGFDVCYLIRSQNQELGYIGILNNKVLKNSGINMEVVYAQLSIDNIKKILIKRHDFKEPSIYPNVERDISILVSGDSNAKKLINTIKKAGGKFLNEVYLFDVYTDDSFNKDTKSYGFKMVFQSSVGTLKDSDVDAIIEKIISRLKKNYQITQR